ncbi:spore gernimation protein GerPC [Halobacillus litoralis]|uniref:Spore gernimation protein GerPC n=1 Tax=Halobacillus litoralis TaxID=45668 RepID=A0A845DLV6_9BACI|nr:spore germination protein GerPC [Halobacillus litoralis]MCA1022539.1 spore germination protein GerPC [Halobacillus litoralis]MYL18416.1 spore gernimation protein GerPC [Halobacillus litoralis]MYL30577.1 spore gernimation protein GerPC [Halobacillus halophilus]MYL38594.1 spore gernimation protein GerPC [Halobacillus litoralis]
MNPYYSWQAWVDQMMKQMEQQQKMIDQLQKKIDQLQSTEPPAKTVIEKIEYHFDQLKIETLEGTLQIGLTPGGGDLSDISDLYTGQNQHAQLPETDEQALHFLHEYMVSDIPGWMNQYCRDHERNVSDEHQERMIADIRKQLPQRLEYYRGENPGSPPEKIYHQVKAEIQHSIAQYLDNLEGDGQG